MHIAHMCTRLVFKLTLYVICFQKYKVFIRSGFTRSYVAFINIESCDVYLLLGTFR